MSYAKITAKIITKQSWPCKQGPLEEKQACPRRDLNRRHPILNVNKGVPLDHPRDRKRIKRGHFTPNDVPHELELSNCLVRGGALGVQVFLSSATLPPS